MKQTPFTFARETAENPSKERVFRAEYRFLFFQLLGFVSIALPLMFLLTHADPTFVHFVQHLAQWAWQAPLLVAVLTFPLTWFYRVRARPEGIHGGTFWSTPVYMTFAEIESVEPRSIIGFPYLRVKSFRESCPTLWIPRFLANPDSFRETVVSSTSSAHPLRKSLQSGYTSEKREPLAR